jgi:hypothetical protein
MSLLVKILEGLLHFAIEHHPAVNLDGLVLVEVLRFANRRNRSAQIAGDLVAAGISLPDLPDSKAWLL